MGEPSRPDTPALGEFRLYEWEVRPDLGRLIRGSTVIQLEPKHMDVLVLLAGHPQEVVSKHDILSTVWEGQFVADAVLTRAIAEIRRALEDDAHNSRFIETIPRRGYRLIAPVVPTGVGSDLKSVARWGAPWLLLALMLAAAGYGLWRINRPQVPAAEPPKTTSPATTPATAPGPRPDPTAKQLTSSDGAEFYPDFSPDGASLAYSADTTGEFEIWVRQLSSGGRERQITDDSGINLQPTWSPDGQHIAYYSVRRGGIWVVPALGGPPRQLSSFGAEPAWSPNSETIVFQSVPTVEVSIWGGGAIEPSTVWLVDLATGNPRPLTSPGEPAGGHVTPSFLPDGRSVLFVTNGFSTAGALMRIPVEGGPAETLVEDFFGNDPAMSPDGRRVYFQALYKGDWWLFALDLEATPSALERILRLPLRHLDVSPQGDRIAASHLTTRSDIWQVPLSQQTGRSTGPAEVVTLDTSRRHTMPVFSPDGRRIAYQSSRAGTRWEARITDLTDGATEIVAGPDPPARSVRWAPDGNSIYFISARVLYRMDLATRRREKVLDLSLDRLAAKTSPDVRRLLYFRPTDAVMNLWTSGIDGGNARQLTFDPEFAGFGQWSPDGRFIHYEIRRGDDTHLMVVPSEGGEPRQVTNERGQTWTNDTSPGGNTLLFAGQRDGQWNVYTVPTTGGSSRRLTRHDDGFGSYVRYPVWSPANDRIVYERSVTTGDLWIVELE